MEVKGNVEKRKAIKRIVELGIVFVALVLCFVPILGARKSSGATGAFLDEIIGDVRTYYNSIKDNHKMKVSVTTEDFRTKANLIYDTFQSIGIDPDELVSSSDSISTIWRNLDGKIKDGSAKPNILTGYIRIKRRVDSYFVKSTQSNCNLQVTEAPYYYKYAQVEAPEATAEKVFLDTSRILKRRVEDLILVYQVHQVYSKNTNGGKTGGAKYLAALRKEIVDAARWGNYWKSTQYIDISEAAYAVSLGY